MRAHVCAQDADFTVWSFLQRMSTSIYVHPSAWNTRMDMCHTCRWECDSCFKCIDFVSVYFTVCFTCMYLKKEKLWTVMICTVALKGHHHISFSLHYINFDLCEKILCDYVYIIILHVYIIILHVYINILHVYIIKYTCIHNYLACIHNYLYMYT